MKKERQFELRRSQAVLGFNCFLATTTFIILLRRQSYCILFPPIYLHKPSLFCSPQIVEFYCPIKKRGSKSRRKKRAAFAPLYIILEMEEQENAVSVKCVIDFVSFSTLPAAAAQFASQHHHHQSKIRKKKSWMARRNFCCCTTHKIGLHFSPLISNLRWRLAVRLSSPHRSLKKFSEPNFWLNENYIRNIW